MERFEIPKFNHNIIKCLDRKKRLGGKDWLQMIRTVCDAIQALCPNPRRSECATIAKLLIDKYPSSLTDRNLDGETLGCGFSSVLDQIKNRIDNVNRSNPLGRIRKVHVVQANDGDNSTIGSKRKQDSYGCISWQPKLNEEDREEQEKMRLEMIDFVFESGLCF